MGGGEPPRKVYENSKIFGISVGDIKISFSVIFNKEKHALRAWGLCLLTHTKGLCSLDPRQRLLALPLDVDPWATFVPSNDLSWHRPWRKHINNKFWCEWKYLYVDVPSGLETSDFSPSFNLWPQWLWHNDHESRRARRHKTFALFCLHHCEVPRTHCRTHPDASL